MRRNAALAALAAVTITAAGCASHTAEPQHSDPATSAPAPVTVVDPVESIDVSPTVRVTLASGPGTGRTETVPRRDVAPLCLEPSGAARIVLGAGTLARATVDALTAAGIPAPAAACDRTGPADHA